MSIFDFLEIELDLADELMSEDQLRADIMRRTIAVLQEPKYEDYKTRLTNWLLDPRGCYVKNGQ